MLKKLAEMNYFVVLVILLGAITVLVAGAFILVASVPAALGSAPPDYEIKEVYQFEPWDFRLNGLEASYPEGGIIVPVYREDKQEAALFLGEGSYRSEFKPAPDAEITGIFIMVDDELFTEIRGDIIFMPVEEAGTRRAAAKIFARQPGLPVIWQSGIPLVFSPRGSSLYYYFIDAGGDPVLPHILIEPPRNLYGAIALYTLFFGVVLLTMLLFSLDHRPSRYWKFMYCTKPGGIALAAVLGAAGLALGGELLPSLEGWPEYTLTLGYLAAAGGLFILYRNKRIDFLDFGLQADTLRYGYLMAAAATVLFCVMTRGLPNRLDLAGSETATEFISVFFMIALAREAIWRGYIQTTLGRQFGALPGLLFTMLLAGLAHWIVATVTAPWTPAYPYYLVEAAVLVPGTALVLGFLYLRTENIISCALLHSLILFLPRIILS